MFRQVGAVGVAAWLLAVGVAHPAPAQGAMGDVDRPTAYLHEGLCTHSGDIVAPLTFPTLPSGTPLGASSATPAGAALSSVPVSLDALLADDYSIHLIDGRTVSCGDIGGVLNDEGALIVGITGEDKAAPMGVAYLARDANNPAQTNVSLFVIGRALNTATQTEGDNANEVASATGSQQQTAATDNSVKVTPEEWIYAAKMLDITRDLTLSFYQIASLTETPRLNDPDWIIQVNGIMRKWKTANQDIQAIIPPPAFVDVHEQYKEMGSLLDSSADDFVAALDTGNPALIRSAGDKLGEAIVIMGEAEKQVDKIVEERGLRD